MNKFTLGLMGAAAFCAAGMVATVPPAEAQQVAALSFSITLGNVGIAYTDGYYDQNRRWHRWRNSQERNWYRQNHRDAYFPISHSRDRDPYRSDWRKGKRPDWRPGQGNPHN